MQVPFLTSNRKDATKRKIRKEPYGLSDIGLSKALKQKP
jgi:hypothetical protein